MPPLPGKRRSLITGASAGIGMAFARTLAARGHDLIITARRADRLETLAGELRAAHGIDVVILPLDLAEPGAVATLETEIVRRSLTVDWAINNAGYGVAGTFDAGDWAVHAAFLRVMVETPTELIWRLLPGMRERGYGRIINIASLAALVPGSAGQTLYAAAKAYLVKFSQSLALENRDQDIRACALCPGFTWSEFHDVTGTRAKMSKLPRFMWQTAETVAEEGIAAVEAGRAVHVTGRVNRAIATAFKLMPDRLATSLTARQAHRWRDASR